MLARRSVETCFSVAGFNEVLDDIESEINETFRERKSRPLWKAINRNHQPLYKIHPFDENRQILLRIRFLIFRLIVHRLPPRLFVSSFVPRSIFDMASISSPYFCAFAFPTPSIWVNSELDCGRFFTIPVSCWLVKITYGGTPSFLQRCERQSRNKLKSPMSCSVRLSRHASDDFSLVIDLGSVSIRWGKYLRIKTRYGILPNKEIVVGWNQILVL